MTTYNTRNPLGSPAAKDLYDNAENFDHLSIDQVNEKWPDRLGNERLTWHGIEKMNQDAIASYGFITLKSFQLGAPLPGNEITLPNQVLLDETNGEYYRWDGSYPKYVPVGSTPDSTGGIGENKWLSVGDAALRLDLKSNNQNLGDSLITVNQPLEGIPRSLHEKNADIISIKDFGAVGDGVTNDDSAFLLASTWLASGTGKRILIPSGVYILTSTFVIPNSSMVEGDGWASTIIKYTGGDTPAFARTNWEDINVTGGERITIRNLKIEDYSPSRTVNWIVDFTNCRYVRLENLWIADPNYGVTVKTERYGVILGRHPDGTYSGDAFVPVVWRCRFNQTFLHINTTDWYVSESELWGNGRSYAFQMRAGGSLTNNQLVGGDVCAVLIHANGGAFLETIRILGNYFDGSYNDINSGAGIKVDTGTTIHNAIISNNTFWHQNNEGIKCDGTTFRSVISDNIFDNCDSDDTGSSDMTFTYSSLNVFSNNIHARNTNAPKTGVARANKASPIYITNNFSGLIDRVTTCLCHDQGLYFNSFYADPAKVIISQSSTVFGSNFNSDAMSSHSNLTTQNLNALVSSGVWYIPNLATVINPPNNTGVGKLEVNYITTNYAIQELTKPATGNKWVRIMDNGAWSSWSAI